MSKSTGTSQDRARSKPARRVPFRQAIPQLRFEEDLMNDRVVISLPKSNAEGIIIASRDYTGRQGF